MKLNISNRTWVTRLAVTAATVAIAASAWATSPELEKAVVKGQPTSKGLSVVEAKAKTKDAEKVVVEGRVKDFVEGQAVFTIADSAMKACSDNAENCPTPWDYCCLSKEEITSGSATVKLVGDAGGTKAIKANLKGVKGIDHLVTVSVEGTAQKDKRGNLVVLATRIYVKP